MCLVWLGREEMKFWEALKELEQGKRICHTHFNDILKTKEQLSRFLANCCPDAILSHLCADWEVVEEPKPTFSFMEIVGLIKKETEFKRPHWQKGKYFFLDEDGYIRLNIYGGKPHHLTIEDIEANDWVEVDHE